jgi:two-component system, OmpR family, response regulator
MEKTILVVDDDNDIRAFLIKALEANGYKAVGAADGEEGWNSLKSLKPDLLITDLNMPGLDGLELLKRVKADEELKNMPAIMLTGSSSDEEIIAGLSRGADHYITKPFTAAKVLAVIRLALEPG